MTRWQTLATRMVLAWRMLLDKPGRLMISQVWVLAKKIQIWITKSSTRSGRPRRQGAERRWTWSRRGGEQEPGKGAETEPSDPGQEVLSNHKGFYVQYGVVVYPDRSSGRKAKFEGSPLFIP